MRTSAGWIASVFLLATAPAAQASHGPLDTLFVLNSMSLPVLVLDPTTGDRHVAYTTDGILTHAWETAGVWQSEAIVDSASLTTYTSFQLRVAPDGHSVAAYVRKGALVCAVSGAGGWQRDTLDVLPGPFYPIALDLNPMTGEPAVAWAHKSASPETPSQVFYARHSSGSWAVQQVDTTSSSWLNVALGLDDAGRPHLAWARPRGDALGLTVLTYAMGAGPDGPFSAAPVDSQFAYYVALEMDRSNGEPRIAYEAGDSPIGSIPRRIYYAFRAPGNVWQHTAAFSVGGYGFASPPALALDDAGNPYICHTRVTPIAPVGARPAAPDDIEACGFFDTGDVFVYFRAGGAGFAPFSHDVVSAEQMDAANGLGAIAGAPGGAVVAWRSPRVNCQPFALSTTQVTATSAAAVGGDPNPGVALAPVWPNPARAGDDLRVEFASPREGEIALELHDLAGRRAASRSLERMPAGRHTLSWSVGDLRPGLYWLTVRSEGQRLGSRAVVILR